MKLSIAICTWNRAASLARTLDSITALRVAPGDEFEIVLVDNNSTDSTASVAQEYAQRLPLRLRREPQPGHAHARNRALEDCRGEVTLWTDDDVAVNPGWLTAYGAAIRKWPAAAFWGGPIRPRFEAPVPRWLDENWETCRGCFATRELGPVEFRMNLDQLPYGANFAVRTEILRQYRFDEQRGHRPGRLVGDDELDLLRRLIQDGHAGYWVPDALVEHIIPADRMTLEYVRQYFAGQGYRVALEGKSDHRRAPAWRREALVQHWLFKLKYRRCRSAVWLSHWIRSALATGQGEYLDEAQRQAAAP